MIDGFCARGGRVIKVTPKTYNIFIVDQNITGIIPPSTRKLIIAESKLPPFTGIDEQILQLFISSCYKLQKHESVRGYILQCLSKMP